jgi:hypothetical protein
MAARKKVGNLKRKSVSMKKAASVKGGLGKLRVGKGTKDITVGGSDHGTHGEGGSAHG